MSTSKQGRSNLRFVWIPGRKKHNRKGKFETTSKNVQPRYNHKRNEPWALGGSYGQTQLIKSDAVDGVSSLPIAMSVLPAAVPAAVVAENVLEPNKKLELNNPNGEIPDACGCDVDNSETSNTATLALHDKKKLKKKNSLDSIEKVTDNNSVTASNSNLADDKLLPNGLAKKNKKKKSKKKKRKSEDCVDGLEQDDDPTVKCLYWTLMCCECSIS